MKMRVADFQVTPQNLMLGSFTTVKPQLCSLRQTQATLETLRVVGTPELVPKM